MLFALWFQRLGGQSGENILRPGFEITTRSGFIFFIYRGGYKMKKFFLAGLILSLTIISGGLKETEAYIIPFEDLSDSTPVTNQYSSLGAIFFNATILTASISLNEFEFPPRSGVKVVFDDGGPIKINFTTPMLNVGGYFTYTVPLTLSFYDTLNNLKGTISSAFSSNLALSGDPGSNPNEFLSFAWTPGISSMVIGEEPVGGSFNMDDLTATPVPAPGTLLLLGSGVAALVFYRWKFQKSSGIRNSKIPKNCSGEKVCRVFPLLGKSIPINIFPTIILTNIF